MWLSRTDLTMRHCNLEEERNTYQNHKCRIGILKSMCIEGSKAEGTSGPSWSFLSITAWKSPAAMFKPSVQPGRDGTPDSPFLNSFRVIPGHKVSDKALVMVNWAVHYH